MDPVTSPVEAVDTAAARRMALADAPVVAAWTDHHEEVYAFLVRTTRSPEVAEDLLQEAFLRLTREIRAGRTPDNVRAWLYRVGANLAVSRGRRISTALRGIVRIGSTSAPPTTTITPETSYLQREGRADLLAVLRDLGPDARAALLLSSEGFQRRRDRRRDRPLRDRHADPALADPRSGSRSPRGDGGHPMTPHDTFLELAAAAIDFELSSSDRGRLDAHLAGCPVCDRSAAAIRGDALGLAHLPSVTLPDRRGTEILQRALHPAATSHPLRLVLVTALLALLALGSLVAGAELLRRSREDLSVVLPVPSSSPTPTPSDTDAPAPSVETNPPPDGVIAYVGVESGRRVIRTVRPDGSGVRTIAEGEAPAWSPDGTLLAFQCPPAGAPKEPPASDICVVNADGSGQRVLVTGARSPSWSPDGASLLFARSVIDAGDTWVVRLDGSAERRLGGGVGSWSPDGTWILLLGASGAEPDATILHPDGTGARQLGRCWGAAWSPDGTQLACTEQQGTEGEMRAISVADGTVGMTFSENAQVTNPTWLSDRRMVLVLSGIGDPAVGAGDHLYLVDWARHENRILLDKAATVTSVAPGGAWLAVNVGETDIHLVSVDGEERTLTTDGTSMDAEWQPRPATAEPSPSPSAAPPFSKLGFGSIHVGSSDVAWASTGTQLYRTADGGATWTEVQPPAPHAPALARGSRCGHLVPRHARGGRRGLRDA